MGQTLAQLRDEIYADIPQILGNEKFPQARINRYINEGQWFVQVELNGLGMKKWEKSASLTLAAATIAGLSVQQAAIPTDLLESPTSLMMIDCGTGIAPGPGIDMRQLVANWGNSFMAPTSTQPAFCRAANLINIFPATISTATLYYLGASAELSLDADATEIPTEFQKFIIEHAENSVQKSLGTLQDMKVAEAEIAKNIGEQYEKFISREMTAKAVGADQKGQRLQ